MVDKPKNKTRGKIKIRSGYLFLEKKMKKKKKKKKKPCKGNIDPSTCDSCLVVFFLTHCVKGSYNRLVTLTVRDDMHGMNLKQGFRSFFLFFFVFFVFFFGLFCLFLCCLCFLGCLMVLPLCFCCLHSNDFWLFANRGFRCCWWLVSTL